MIFDSYEYLYAFYEIEKNIIEIRTEMYFQLYITYICYVIK